MGITTEAAHNVRGSEYGRAAGTVTHLESTTRLAHILVVGEPHGIGRVVRRIAGQEREGLVEGVFVVWRPEYALEAGLPWIASFLVRVGLGDMRAIGAVDAEEPALVVAIVAQQIDSVSRPGLADDSPSAHG